jgi:dTDP-4-amino-4,6-dideoxy-D-galactose acyltransferase
MDAGNDIELLAWDSEFLGFGVARLSFHNLTATALKQQITNAQQAGAQLLYLVCSPDDNISNAAAHEVGAVLVDRKVTFAMPVEAALAQLGVPDNIHAATTPTAPLESLALQSGEYSRFRLDNHFPPGTYERLYRQWLHNSLARTLAREVLVYQPAPAAPELGLLTLGIKQGRADIGLLAVDSSGRGQGVGTTLVQAARQLTVAWGLPALQVVTQQDNQPACAFYQHCGFVVQTVEHVYHLWLPT